jgi:hypothetical protein
MALLVKVFIGGGLAEDGDVNIGIDRFGCTVFWITIGGTKCALMEVKDALDVGEKS